MTEILRKHQVIVVSLEHYNPLGVLRTLGENGVEPIFIGIDYRVPVASASKYVKKLYRVKSIDEAFETTMREYGSYA